MRRGVVLIGMRGAGKSTVAPRLAALLGLPARDSDAEIERRTGRTVGDLLRARRLRAVERDVVAEFLDGAPAVLALGGGAVLWDGLAAAVRDWTVVWLDAAPGVLARRVAADATDRPSLTGDDAVDELGAVARDRAPRYRALARHRIDAGVASPDALARRIAELLHGDDKTDAAFAD